MSLLLHMAADLYPVTLVFGNYKPKLLDISLIMYVHAYTLAVFSNELSAT